MKLQHVRAMARKEWRHLLRDPRSLALIVLMPAMLLFLFGYAIRLDIEHAPLGVVMESGDGTSRDLVARFDASRAFEVSMFLDRQALRGAIGGGEVWAGLVIPADFASRLAGGDASVQLVLDGVDANSARLVRNYSLGLLQGWVMEVTGARLPVRIDTRTWFNQASESRLAIVPGVIAVVMAVIGALMTSLTVAREMELGNLVMLRTTALTRGEFLVGKLVPYFCVGMVDLLVSVAAAVLIFGVPLRGSFWALVLVAALFLVVVMLQGALISLTAGNQLLASQMSLVSTFLPAFLLSGFVFAIENMPVVLQYLTYAVPARYFVSLSKTLFLKGVPLSLLWAEVAILAGILALLVLVLARRSRGLDLAR